MIVDLPRFVASQRPVWTELENMLGSGSTSTLQQAQRFHYLYQKTSADLGRVATFASEPELRRYLEGLVARAYAEIHETRERGRARFRPFHWFFVMFPAAFRRHANAFWLSLALTTLGALFGALAVNMDDEAKAAIVPGQFAHVLQDPSKRVAEEESNARKSGGGHATFAAQLMQNNIGVSIKALAMGMTAGIGTIIMLFYNGALLGLVGADFIRAGESVFLAGWLLPHGSVELPAIIIAGQGGFMLARALVGWGERAPIRARFRRIGTDLATIIGGVAVMLVWAGLVESYFSQHHHPVIPYSVKIAFGSVQLLALAIYLGSGWWVPLLPKKKEKPVSVI